MKNYRNIFLVFAAALVIMTGLAACGDDDSADPSSALSITADGAPIAAFAADAAGASRTIDIVTDGDWDVKMLGSNTSWLTVTPASGHGNATVTVTVAANTTTSKRAASVSFTVGGIEAASINIAQAAYGPGIAVTPAIITLPVEGGDASANIASNGDEWEYEIVATGDWLTATKATGKLTFSAPENTGNERSATVTFTLVNYPAYSEVITVKQLAKELVPTYYSIVDPSESETFDLGDGTSITFEWQTTNIDCNTLLLISMTDDFNTPLKAVELSEKSKTFTATELDMELYIAGVATGAERTLYWTLKPVDKAIEAAITEPTPVKLLTLKRPFVRSDALHGDLLDAVFNLDTTATDASGYGNQILSYFRDRNLKVVYNNTYQRYEVIFNPKGGQNATGNATQGDWYRVNYMNDQTFKDRLSDGHTFECLVRFDWNYVVNSVTYETKWFASHEAGGTGFLISTAAHASGANGITWLPNTTTGDGGSNTYRWANSQVKPDGSTYYHLVGVWDNVGGKAIIYVDGVKKSEVVATGTLRLASATSQWIGIGGDPSGDNCSNQFIGSIVIARVYDAALTEAQVTTLWNQAKP
ncbi:MAG: SusE domain-containing protein [Bacteroidales bacterium]|jgi:hypothetical protein|nr:SusE domain-containing protein [Bacteroidales bacterium]